MTQHRLNTSQWFGLLGWLVLCYAVAALGAMASIQAASFYAQLQRPAWAPPGWLFGSVWTVLYGMMAVSVWSVWRRGGWAGARVALTLFLVQLALNGLWSWLFFAWHLGAWAFTDIVALWLVLAATIGVFAKRQALAAWLLVPYLAWVSFAAALNFSVWQLNPQMLG
ncbi:tryptophan-rich sensory protein [Xanthomonas citri pv. citri]|uniref:TspO/MBR family protein n=2 Tax=Xanthomonas citri TaxID=346 RepID=A0A0U5FCS1_XANCI|nr:TspO/MBR family protein [Xanthomonas citri]AGI08365.1 Tryptophan-rich sensory protein [Xanthomonas citri subsp. citri Aw12879]AJZ44705.1 TspO and MBR related protein [Xanthomonas citri pv. citri]AJZ49322.1 TspO and MBR related protein [Xanthomonas citri pv. citri]AJZ53941.1 TspO and MBR related protein [Xanthomonas citri pv. citri]AJZ66736.1 TspO and MBR related protein [Xanthomonas citri pv. citri]